MSSRRGVKKAAAAASDVPAAAAAVADDAAMEEEEKKGTKRARSNKKTASVKIEPPASPTAASPAAAAADADADAPLSATRKSSRAAKPRVFDGDFVVDGYGSDDEEALLKGKRASKKLKRELESDDDADDAEAEEADEEDEEEQKAARSKKRKASTKKVKKEEDAGEDDAEEGEGDGDDSEAAGGSKKKKAAAKPRVKKEKVPKEPKAPKVPKPKKEPKPKKVKAPKKRRGVFLAPLSAVDDAALLAELEKVTDVTLKATTVAVDSSCCSRCSSRECFRAVETNNLKLLESACEAYDKVATPFLPWSADVTETCLHRAIRTGDRFLVRKLLHELNLLHWSNAMHNNYSSSSTKPTAATEKEPAVRVQMPTNSLAKDTGSTSFMSYGHRVAQVQLSRGGKEGNNAFTSDPARSTARFEEYLQFLLANGTNTDLLDVFAQSLDPERTTYVNAMASLKPVAPSAKPTLMKQKSQLKDALAASAAANGAASAAAGASVPVVFDIHTREDKVLQVLSQQAGFHTAVEAGNLPMARAALAFIQKRNGGGLFAGVFNTLHTEAMGDSGKPFSEKFKPASATKKGGGSNHSVTPIHLAAINPDTRYLKELFDSVGQQLLQTTDDMNRGPVHYAAVCSSPEPLKFLIDKGANIFAADRRGETALGLAVKHGKAHNIALLVPQVANAAAAAAAAGAADDDAAGDDEDAPRKKAKVEPTAPLAMIPSVLSNINTKDKRSFSTLFHVACTRGHAPTVKALLDCGADPFIVDKDKRTGLVLACQQGHLEIVKIIYTYLRTRFPDEKELERQQKKQFLALDKQHRLPIFYAVKNGHLEVTRFLLVEVGLPADCMDSSDNNLMHYAAAYGWPSIVNLLLVFIKHAPAGSKIATLAGACSIWRTTSLFIASLKSHLLTASMVLSAPGVDVNVRDKDGLTILHQVIAGKNSNAEQCQRQLNFLIAEKGADVLLRDPKTQRTVLHMLAALPCMPDLADMDIALATLFLKHGIDVDAADSANTTALFLALQSVNFPLVRFLLQKGARVNVSYANVSQTPLMQLLSCTRSPTAAEKDYLEKKKQYDQNLANSRRWNASYPEDAAKAAENKIKAAEYEANRKKMDEEFEEEKEKILAIMLEAGQKTSDVKRDAVQAIDKASAASDAAAAAVAESKSDEEEEDEDDDEDDEEHDDDDDEGASPKSKKADAAMSPVVAAAAASSGAELAPKTLHYLNGRDGLGETLLMRCVQSPRASSLLQLVFAHSLKHANGDRSSGYDFDLTSRDNTGRNVLFRAAQSPTQPRELVGAILRYAQTVSGNAPAAGAAAAASAAGTPSKKGKGKAAASAGAAVTYSSSPSLSVLDLNCVLNNGQTLLSTIISSSSGVQDVIAPVKALHLLQELINVGGLNVATAQPVITMHRKKDAPPNPPPRDPAHPDKEPVKFEWDGEIIRTAQLLSTSSMPAGCTLTAAEYAALRAQLPHYDVQSVSFLSFLLNQYFRWGGNRVNGRPADRILRQESGFLQLIDLTLQRCAAGGPAVIKSLLSEKSFSLPHGNLLHRIFAQAKTMNLKPLLQLLCKHCPAALLREAGSEVDKDGCVPLLVLAHSVLPLPVQKPELPQTRSTLEELLIVDLSSDIHTGDDNNNTAEAGAAAGGEGDASKQQESKEDQEEDDEEMNSGSDNNGEDEDMEDDEAEQLKADAQQPAFNNGFNFGSNIGFGAPSAFGSAFGLGSPSAAASAAAPAAAPAAGSANKLVKLAPVFVHTAADVTELMKLYLDTTQLSVDVAVEKKWHDPATLKRRKDVIGASAPANQQLGLQPDNDDEDDEEEKAQALKMKKPRCQYWAGCYRKNPVHLQDFLHPADLLASPAKAAAPRVRPAGAAAARAGQDPLDEFIIPEQLNLKQTFLHLAVFNNAAPVVEYLVNQLRANVLATDYKQRIPLLLCCVLQSADPVIPALLLTVQGEAQVLQKDLTGAHALSLCCQNSNKLQIVQLLLKHAPATQISLQDNFGRTALHYSVNYSGRRHGDETARGFEEAFALESVLLSAGADINAVDADGRTALHYVFVPVASVYANSAAGKVLDPIELVSDVCAVTPKKDGAVAPVPQRAQSFIHRLTEVECHVKVDVADKYGRTPILYAAQNGAQICVKYLQARSASLKTVDAEGNSVFQHALAYKHMSLAVELLSSPDVDLTRPIVQYTQQLQAEQEALLAAGQAAEALALAQKIQQLKMESTSTFCHTLRQGWIGLAFLMLDTSAFSIATGIKDALDNNLLSLVQTIIKKTPPAKLADVDPATGRDLLHIICCYLPRTEAARAAFATTWSLKWIQLLAESARMDYNSTELVFGYTALHFAAIRNHEGLARWLLTQAKAQPDVVGFNGFTPLLLAARHNNFGVIKALHEADRNIFKNSRAKGITQAKDGTTLLHWACVHENFEMLHYLLENDASDINPVLDRSVEKFDLKWIDRAPRAESFEANEALRHQREKITHANRFKFPYSFEENHPRFKQPVSPLQVLLTPLSKGISASKFDLLRLLVAYGADSNLYVLDYDLDSQSFAKLRGASLLMYAALENNSRLLALLMNQPDPLEVEAERKRLATVPIPPPPRPTLFQQANAPKNRAHAVDYNLADSAGQTIVHRFVVPLGAGEPSYENTQMLKQIVLASRAAGKKELAANLEAKDNAGNTPLYYAYQQASGRMSSLLLELGARADAKMADAAKEVIARTRMQHKVDWVTWPAVDAAADAAQVEAAEEARLEALVDDPAADAKQPPIAVDKYAGDLIQSCIVYKDASAVSYSLEMTFTEVNAGPWGKHAFYVMQLLLNPLQQLPVLFTRWGRVGEEGQHQQTPFSSIELGIAEFEKIFKSKSGNNWQTQRTKKTFVPMDNKYHLLFKKQSDASTQLMQPLDTIIARNAAVLPPLQAEAHIHDLVKLFCDVSRINLLFKEMGYEDESGTEIASKLVRSVLEKGYEKLKKISALIPTLQLLDAQLKQQSTLRQQMEYQKEQREREKKDKAAAAASSDAMDVDAAEKKSEDDDLDLDVQPINDRIAAVEKERAGVSDEITRLSNEFYQLVPQPGARSMAIRAITDLDTVKKYVNQFLQFIDLQATKKMLIGCQLNPAKLHPLDYCYYALGVSLQRVQIDEPQYEWISQYVYASGQSKNQLEIYGLYRLNRRGEDERFAAFQHLSNRTLLWHGSGLVNYNGILSNVGSSRVDLQACKLEYSIVSPK